MKRYLLIILFLVFPLFSHAATATLFVDTGYDIINTLEATLIVPASVTIKSMSTGDSMVLIWIKEPALDAGTHSITFTGLTPGGFTGKGAIFSFSGDFTREDLKQFSFRDITALKNDGKGTAAKVTLSILSSEASEDKLPPVAFTPVVGKSEDISDGASFVSFLTQDKGSGIDYYEIAMKLFGSPDAKDFRTVTSPVVLTKPETFKTLYIKAVDRAGNTEVAVVPGPNRYAGIFVLVILCIIIFVCAPFLRRRLLFS
jgi:hypothetical protein